MWDTSALKYHASPLQEVKYHSWGYEYRGASTSEVLSGQFTWALLHHTRDPFRSPARDHELRESFHFWGRRLDEIGRTKPTFLLRVWPHRLTSSVVLQSWLISSRMKWVQVRWHFSMPLVGCAFDRRGCDVGMFLYVLFLGYQAQTTALLRP